MRYRTTYLDKTCNNRNMNLTLQIPIRWLQELHPQYEQMKVSVSLTRRMVVELLHVCAQRYEGNALVVAPSEGHEGGIERVMAYVPDFTARAISIAAASSNLSPGVVAKSLLYGLWKQKPETPVIKPKDHPLADVLLSLNKSGLQTEVRTEQLLAFDFMNDALSYGRIGMVEASTGIGKGLALVMASILWSQKNGMRACICAPTLALIRQTAHEYQKISTVREVPPLRVFFGKREFVSQLALAEILESKQYLAELFPEAGQWLKGNGKGEQSLGQYTESNWLAENLRRLAPDFPVEEVVLNDATLSGDAGMISYRAQFTESSCTEELILCTHSMLAYDMRRKMICSQKDKTFSEINQEIQSIYKRLKALKLSKLTQNDEHADYGLEEFANIQQLKKLQLDLTTVFTESDTIIGLLPRYRALIVDEAHLLEQSFSHVYSDHLALRTLLQALEKFKDCGGSITKAAIDKAKGMIDILSHKTPVNRLTLLSSQEMTFARGALDELLCVMRMANIRSINRNTNPEQVKALIEIRRGHTLVKQALKSGTARAYLRLSPQRFFPQLYVGSDNLDQVLKLLWGGVDAGVAVSATLYLRRTDGPSANYMAKLLNIPEDRRGEYPPVEAKWLLDCIEKVHVCKGKDAQALRPPSRRDKLTPEIKAEKTKLWLNNLANEIKNIHANAVGGVLVLTTSYATVEDLTILLAEVADLIVSSQEGKSLQRQSSDFISLQLSGKKALWLSVGGAWTGLDVGGHDPMERLLGLPQIPASQDNLLTDLIIPRLPFGTNNSITHLRRIAMGGGVPWDILDAAFRMLQGLGRLVRRKGLPQNRRIWILDGRLDEPLAKQKLALFWSAIESKIYK